MNTLGQETFEEFFERVEPRLRRALSSRMRRDRVQDAVASALTFAFQNWDRVSAMEHPVAYLYRVAQSKSRLRREALLPPPPPQRAADVEPALVAAMQSLPRRQREAVWLIDACGWPAAEVAAALGISQSAVRTHRTRALRSLRNQLGVEIHA